LIIDIHTHLGIVKSWSSYLRGHVKADLLDLLDYMDDVGISVAVLLPLPGRVEPDSDIISSDEAIRVAKKYPGRIVPFCVIDPRVPRASEKIKKYANMGCKGFGEYKVKMKISDPLSIKIYKTCFELGLPILIHMDKKFNPDIHEFVKVLEEVPDAIFIMHGPGWWSHISGQVDESVDYPKGRVIPGGLVKEILKRYKNVYADISAYSGLNALERDPEHAKKFLEEFSDRILYGTDFPCIARLGNQYGPNREHLNFLLNQGISKQALERILYKNAVRLLDL